MWSSLPRSHNGGPEPYDVRGAHAARPISNGKKTIMTYGDWLTKNGIKWSEGTEIPDSWRNAIPIRPKLFRCLMLKRDEVIDEQRVQDEGSED